MRILEKGTDGSPITLYDFEPTPDRICDDVAQGLSRIEKMLPSKYFYDEVGAELFERIMELDAYYPTRTETRILKENASEIATEIGTGVRLVEFGSGSGDKTWIVLRHLRDLAAYIPVDISRAQLIEFALHVTDEFPELPVLPVCADYTAEFELPAVHDGGRSVAFFPGSTIGNFDRSEAQAFLSRVRKLVGPDGGMLLGLDLLKDPEQIELAYNDPEGVTAEFNLNLLRRINRECGGDFDISSFYHHAVFDRSVGRIEMRLVSQREQTVNILSDPDTPEPTAIHFDAGEHITTEYSHKYDLQDFGGLAGEAGWSVQRVWTDPDRWFAVVLLK